MSDEIEVTWELKPTVFGRIKYEIRAVRGSAWRSESGKAADSREVERIINRLANSLRDKKP